MSYRHANSAVRSALSILALAWILQAGAATLDAALARAEALATATEGSLAEGAVLHRSAWLDAGRLAYQTISGTANPETFVFDAVSGWREAAPSSVLPAAPARWPPGADMAGEPGPEQAVSPDGRWAVGHDGANLVLSDRRTGTRRLLTTDGDVDRAYGAGAALNWSGQVTLERAGIVEPPAVLWAADSSRFVSFVVDTRGVRRVPLVETRTDARGLPDIVAYDSRTPHAGDAARVTAQLLLFTPADSAPVRVELDDPIFYFDPVRGGDLRWSEDGRELYFVTHDFTWRRVTAWRIEAATGRATRILRHASSFGVAGTGYMPIPGERQLVWPALHLADRLALYRVDLDSGEVLNRISGERVFVDSVIGVRDGWVYYLGGVDNAGVDPYLRQLMRARVDGSREERLTPAVADHAVEASPDLAHFLVTVGRLDEAPRVEVLDRAGRVLEVLADPRRHADVPAIERIRGTGADGRTEIWGTLFKPSDFDPSRSYPVIQWVHGTAGINIAPLRLDGSRTARMQALAELGFIVLVIDGSGNIGRTRAFLDMALDAEPCVGLPDQIAVMHQLASQRPYMDLERVGITGVSQGGRCSTRGLLKYPEDFHVAVSISGSHDLRMNHFSEIFAYMGKPEAAPALYLEQANASLVAQLRGKLLLMHGTVDEDTHPENTLTVVAALIAAHKPFDLLMLPNQNHAASRTAYARHRMWAYFSEHLLGVELPVFK
jgi:dipeptidyl aminopeptidase/acylaminoacyl peptidase